MIYDYLIVGSGLYGATCAYELKKRGLKVLVVEKRNHIGGNVFTKNISGIKTCALPILMFVCMVHIYFIQIKRKFGII